MVTIDRKNSLIAGSLIGSIIVLLSAGMLIIFSLSSFNIVDFESSFMAGSRDGDQKPQEFLTYFNNSTPEAAEVSTAHAAADKYKDNRISFNDALNDIREFSLDLIEKLAYIIKIRGLGVL